METRTWFFIFALFCISGSIKGQFSLQGSVGAALTNILNYPTSVSTTSNFNNWYISAYPEFRFNSKFSIGIELQGITKGFHFKDAATHKILYLDMIPQAEYKPINLLGIVLGAGTSVNLNESVKVGDVWQDTIFNFSNEINLSWIAGIRLYPLKKWNISVQYCNTNLARIEFTDALGNIIDTQLLKLGTVKLGIGYRFI